MGGLLSRTGERVVATLGVGGAAGCAAAVAAVRAELGADADARAVADGSDAAALAARRADLDATAKALADRETAVVAASAAASAAAEAADAKAAEAATALADARRTAAEAKEEAAAAVAAAEAAAAAAAPAAAAPAEVPDPPAPVCRSAPAGSRAGSFLIVFMGHSGSTALLSELGQHSGTHVALPEPVDHEPYQRNTTAALAYTRAFFTAGRAKGLVPGFKIRPWHIEQDPDAWRALTEEFDTRLIWNFRVNVLKASVGEYTARYLNDTSVIEGLRPGTEATRCSTGAGCRFAVQDMDFLHGLMRMFVSSDRRISAAVEALQQSGDGKPRRCVLTAPYEEYLLSRRVVMRQVHTFLGLGDEDHQPSRGTRRGAAPESENGNLTGGLANRRAKDGNDGGHERRHHVGVAAGSQPHPHGARTSEGAAGRDLFSKFPMRQPALAKLSRSFRKFVGGPG